MGVLAREDSRERSPVEEDVQEQLREGQRAERKPRREVHRLGEAQIHTHDEDSAHEVTSELQEDERNRKATQPASHELGED